MKKETLLKIKIKIWFRNIYESYDKYLNKKKEEI